MHVLSHTDGTLIVSTSRLLFKKKCSIMVDYFMENKLRLNLDMSCYLIINGKRKDKKVQYICKMAHLNTKMQLHNLV